MEICVVTISILISVFSLVPRLREDLFGKGVEIRQYIAKEYDKLKSRQAKTLMYKYLTIA